MTSPTLILIPCLTGAPWNVGQLSELQDYSLATLPLDAHHSDIESHATDVLRFAEGRGPFVLVGDSFGAQVALAAAVRQPPELVALVMSGGFAANPVNDRMTRIKVFCARLMPGPLYRNLVIPMHADLLRSQFDSEGDRGWSREETIALFRLNTSWSSYCRRTRAAMAADYRAQLDRVRISTLILTPEDDRLIGHDAAEAMLTGIAGAEEIVIPHSGHMFRFSHPKAYSDAIRRFLARKLSAV